MIEEPKLPTIKRPARRPSAAQIATFQDTPTSFVVDAMFGDGSLATEIVPLPDVAAKVTFLATACRPDNSTENSSSASTFESPLTCTVTV